MSELSKNKIKWIRSFHQKKYRDEHGLFLVEGEKMVSEAIEFAHDSIDLILHTKEFHFAVKNIETVLISTKELEQISGLKTPNKVVAVLRKQENKSEIDKNKLIIALDGVQDPGNMGTILRIADWYGIKDIVCSANTVEIYNPKVIQSSMGAIFRIQTHYVDLKHWLAHCSLPIYGALLEGKNVYHEKLDPKGVLLMGNEGSGISASLLPVISDPISIPRFGQAESLNVAVATGILVSEFMRNKGQKD